MNSIQIESWALRIIDRVISGQPNEDFLVELKSRWIDEEKAARRIAGHANSAMGENILWLIGVDEQQGVVIGANLKDLSSWYPTVESYFHELAPRLIPLNISVDGKTIVALLFETDRAPFVIKNSAFGQKGGGSVELEVPWRENTATRSARRSDLIRLLTPSATLPDIEILSTSLAAIIEGTDEIGNYHPDALKLHAELYIVPKDRDRIVIPFHKCRVLFKIAEVSTYESHFIKLNPSRGYFRGFGNAKPGSITIQSTAHEIIIDDPGKVSLEASTGRPSLPNSDVNIDVHISIHLFTASANRPIVLTKTLSYPKERDP